MINSSLKKAVERQREKEGERAREIERGRKRGSEGGRERERVVKTAKHFLLQESSSR